MRGRILVVGYAFVAVFAIVAWQEARIQLLDRSAIAAHPGDPRRAQSIALRGELLDAAGQPLARSVGSRRVYDAGPALAQIIGYSSTRYGESGLEAALDPFLAPPGTSEETQLGRLFGGSTPAAGQGGARIVLTLRRDIASIADQAFPAGARGAVVVLDPRSGAILAAVSHPSYNPNRLAAVWNTLRSQSDAPLLDRALEGVYPPGSTFKMVTASAALDSGAFTPQSTFNDPGYFTIGGFTLHNAEHEATGVQPLVNAFAYSSNVDFAQIGVALGVPTFYDYLKRFHVGDDMNLPVAVAKDEVPEPDTVSPSELAQMAFGQASLAVTPLRIALIAATIADRGVLMRPWLVKQIQVPGRPALRTIPVAWGRPIAPQTADDVRSFMEAVVRYGTGTAAQLRGVTVAGKTGTATHPGGPPDAWFACFAPADDPRLVVAVVVEDAGYGGVAAAPVARHILAAALPVYP